jgi:Transglutaminase-like superfamily
MAGVSYMQIKRQRLIPLRLFAAMSALVLVSTVLPVSRQHCAAEETLVNLAKKETTRWQVGVTLQAEGGPCMDLYATVPVPAEWPEQKVREVARDISPLVADNKFRSLENGVQQFLISIPRLPAGSTAQAIITFEIDRFPMSPPSDPDSLRMPKRLPNELKRFLGASPMIETRNRKIRELAKDLEDPELSPWKQVEKFYDHVRDHVKYMNGPLKGAAAALRDGTGDCEELTSLIIALCRIHGVAARTVWVPDHCYPEFYLEDQDGVGHWYPCQAAGTREFGGISELRPILQKGDNFKVPEKKERQRYVAEYLTGSTRGGGKPKVTFVRKQSQDKK